MVHVPLRKGSATDLENCIEDETDRRFVLVLRASEKAVENSGTDRKKPDNSLSKDAKGAAGSFG